jgi:hypothetical protein
MTSKSPSHKGSLRADAGAVLAVERGGALLRAGYVTPKATIVTARELSISEVAAAPKS